MPKALIDFLGYSFYFWSNENNEPVHIHVCKGKPSENSSKFWIKSDEVIMEHNNAGIKAKDLKKIMKYLDLNKRDIVFEWYRHFGS